MKKKQLINNLYYFAALTVIAGIVSFLSGETNAPYIYTTGCILYATSRGMHFYIMKPDKSDRIPQIQLLGSVLLVVSAYFMLKESNSWSLFLFLTAIIEIYTSFRTKEQ